MIYLKTDEGKEALKVRSLLISPRQRSALILINGERTVEYILKMCEGLGFTMADIDHLVHIGLIEVVPSHTAISTPAQPNTLISQQAEPLGGFVDIEMARSRYKLAYPLATQLTASLGLRGFRLNLAVEAAGSYSQLVALFPKIQAATGAEKAGMLENALRGSP